MRYLKVFGVPVIICMFISLFTICSYFEKNSEETLNNSSINIEINTNKDFEVPSEEIINVDETSSNENTIEEPVSDEQYERSINTINVASRGYYDRDSAYKEDISTDADIPAIEENDVNDTNSESYSDGIEKHVPSGRGRSHTFMGWQMVTNVTSKQYKLKMTSGETYDSNGFAKINERFVVATKPYYGTIGDYIDVYKANGEIIKCIIGDQKGSDGGGDIYGHADGSIIEFVVDKYMWYSAYNGLGRYLSVSDFYPSWTNNNITKIINIGNYWS